ncbi:beta-propeller fold lactonase family protein [Parashewanella tropica]|uniref:beta-propeller fold lactonase family protein n=1 Tax=Parashewanella tropica TaxID=2547970 RepID=UPI00105982D3|nr:beta-propeller fold lactonase family protein [Parashewanella tropica]
MKYGHNLISKGWKPFAAGLASLLIVACGSDKKDSVTPPQPTQPSVVGFIYTTTNGEGDNQIIRLARYSDGSLGDEKVYDTFGTGGINADIGGIAHGDYDTQGAIQIVGNYLFTVNGGSNSISVFQLNRENGELTYFNNIPSKGQRPATLAFTKKKDSDTEYWMVVGNQWDNPNIQHGGGSPRAIERYPNNEYFADRDALKQTSDSDKLRNIELFSFDSDNGSLTPEGDAPLATYVQYNGGPTTVTFSDDGSKLAVATWGVPHLFAPQPSEAEMQKSRVYVYDFNNETGATTGSRFWEEDGISGSVGINWAKGSNSIIHVSNINQVPEKSDNGLVVLSDNGTAVSKTQNFKTGETDTQDYACWTALSPDGKRVYVASFYTNLITPFDLNEDGTVANDKALPYAKRGDIDGPFDSKDIWVSPDNKYIYNLGAFQTYSVSWFGINDAGLEFKSSYTIDKTKDDRKGFRYHYIGLTGFDLEK